MDENTQAHRLKVQRGWLIYMGIITGLYAIFGLLCFIELIGLSIPSFMGFLAGGMFIHGWITVWFNYILVVSAVGYGIYCYTKDKQQKIFSHTIILASLNIVGSIGVQLWTRVAMTA